MTEQVWTFDDKLRRLDNRLVESTTSIEEKFDRKFSVLDTAVKLIKADVLKDITTVGSDLKRDLESCLNDVRTLKNDIDTLLQLHNQAINQREIVMNNTMCHLDSKISRMHFDIIDNEDNVSVTYVNPDGKIEYGAIRKFVPDEKTITTVDKKISLKYKFDPKDFNIKNDDVKVVGLSLVDGKHITADRINNDLNNATYNVSVLTLKVTNIIDKLHTVNGYVVSNNFKKAIPTEDQLYNFAISCMSTSSHTLTRSQVPSYTKIKNTFNDHVWVLNRTVVDGLQVSKWEDFGSDSVCVASNDGALGLVTGSQERYMGHIDLQGRISINGLEEDLNEILKSIENINTDLIKFQTENSAKLNDVEIRLRKLEA